MAIKTTLTVELTKDELDQVLDLRAALGVLTLDKAFRILLKDGCALLIDRHKMTHGWKAPPSKLPPGLRGQGYDCQDDDGPRPPEDDIQF